MYFRCCYRMLLAGLAISAGSARSFEIGGGPKRPVHEALTSEAIVCLAAAGGDRPTRCTSSLSFLDREHFGSLTVDLSKVGLDLVGREDLEAAVRWPDDPTREISLSGITKFLAKFAQQCQPYRNGIAGGLLCNSHFGTLQFFHAMASMPDESTSVTQQKVLAWARFAYGVATGAIDTAADYCQQIRSDQSPITDALAPEFFGCKAPTAWTVGTLFSFVCPVPWSSKKCGVLSGLTGKRTARLSALGAILHLVQDSYAQGHGRRGACALPSAKGASRYECLGVSQFYSYTDQDPDLHSKADAPSFAGASCVTGNPLVDDPILASATVLWLAANNAPAAALEEYLAQRVFPLTPDAAPASGPGACFKKQVPH